MRDLMTNLATTPPPTLVAYAGLQKRGTYLRDNTVHAIYYIQETFDETNNEAQPICVDNDYPVDIETASVNS